MLSPLWSCALPIPSQLLNILALSLSYHLSPGGLAESKVYEPGTVLVLRAEMCGGVLALPCWARQWGGGPAAGAPCEQPAALHAWEALMVLNPRIPLCTELPRQDGPSVLTVCVLMGFLQQLHY